MRNLPGDAMNMNFQRPHVLDLELRGHDSVTPWTSPIDGFEPRPGRLRFIGSAALGLATLYLLADAGVVILLSVIGVLALILGIAAAVCIYAQNNSPL